MTPNAALLVWLVLVVVTVAEGGHYLNQYAVDVLPGQDPDVVARDAGCENTGKPPKVNYFLKCFQFLKLFI